MFEILASLIAVVTTFGYRLITTALVLWIGSKLIKWIVGKVSTAKAMDKLDSNLRSFAASGTKIALNALLIIVCASILGIPTTSFITVLASCGVAVGLALQGALSNVAGGIMILVFHPFHAGDFIEAAGVMGVVKGVSVFYTFIETVDNKLITVPNGALTGSAITNYSSNGNRRVDINFSTSYNSDIEYVKATMLKVANAHEKVLQDPAPFARLTQQGDSALVFTLRVWCKNADYWDVNFDMIENMKKEFDAAGIKIPYPQMDVHLDK